MANLIDEIHESCAEGVEEIIKRRRRDKPSGYFSTRLKSLRKHLGLSQQEFAETFGISYINVRNWEQKDRGLPNDVAQTYLKIIEQDPTTVEELVRSVKKRDLEETV